MKTRNQKQVDKATNSRLGTILDDKFFGLMDIGADNMAWCLTNPDTEDFALLTHSESDPTHVDTLGVDAEVNPDKALWTVSVFSGDKFSDSFDVVGILAAIRWCEVAISNPKPWLTNNG